VQKSYEKLLAYIDAIEKTNAELVNTQKKCVELLIRFKDMVPNPEGWQEMLDLFQETIKIGERTVEEKTLH
jgi:hypothetical protein